MAYLDYDGLSHFLDKLKTTFPLSSTKGEANGLAELDSNGKVPSSQLPSYVDDVLEFDSKDFSDWTEWVASTSYAVGDKVKITDVSENVSGYICKTANEDETFDESKWDVATKFPAQGSSGVIYIDTNTNLTYRWSGSAYVPIASDLALGETSSTAYRGDRGAAAYAAAVTDVDSTPIANSTHLVTSGGVAAAIPDITGKADKADTVLDTTLSRGRKANSTVGTGSFAFGSNIEASGNYSHAEGNATKASGEYTHAEGDQTQAVTSASHAEGKSTIAYGIYSHAEGEGGTYTQDDVTYTSRAFGESDHTEGYQCLTDNGLPGDHAEGYRTRATGGASHSEGCYTLASGLYSHAEGKNTTASSSYSHAEGEGGVFTYKGTDYASGAFGSSAHAEGYQTRAAGNGSHSEGFHTFASGQYSHSEGNQTSASAQNAHAEGQDTIASGIVSHAEGYGGTYTLSGTTYTSGAKGMSDHTEGYQCLTESSMPGNHAEGYQTRSTGGGAHSEGQSSFASGYVSHAEGCATKASGEYTHAEGYQTTASANSAHAEGYSTTASGKYAHVEGYYTNAVGKFSHVSGMYNAEDNYSNWSEWVANTSYVVGDKVKRTSGSEVSGYVCKTANSDSSFNTAKWIHQDNKMNYAEIIGNGTSNSARSNARVLDWDGNERLKGDVYVGCNADSTGGIKVATVSDIPDVSAKADKTNTILETTLSRGRKANTAVGTGSFAFGNDVEASNQYSHAEGDNTIASGMHSHAEGRSTTASGTAAHAEGYNTTASGSTAHAEGYQTTASETYSHAEGCSTTASGSYSHAEGDQTTASGANTHAEGSSTLASGAASHVEGVNTIAAGANSHVSGKYNVEDSYSNWSEWTANTSYVVGDKVKRTTDSGVSGYICKTDNSDSTFNSSKWIWQNGQMNYAEIIGNGIDNDNRSNARTLDWDGNERLAGNIYVGCNADSTGGTMLTPPVNMTGATSSVAGTAGYVPAPSAGDNEKFLKGDGTWAEIGGNTLRKVTFSFATTDWTQSSNVYTATLTDSNITSGSEEIITYTNSLRNLTSDIDAQKDSSNHAIVFTVDSMPTGVISGSVYVISQGNIVADSKVDINQGIANAGKFLIVNSQGNVEPVSMQAWQGGSY